MPTRLRTRHIKTWASVPCTHCFTQLLPQLSLFPPLASWQVRPPPVPLPHQAQSERYPGKSALIIGATGATGQHLLRYLLSSPEYTRVAEFGRRLTSTSDPKLEQHTLDFEKLGADDQGLKAGRWDVVFLTYAHTPRMLLVDIDGCFQTGYHPCGCRKC
jgi:hypothetical protein